MNKSKLFWILGLAYVIDRIFYPDKYKKKDPESSVELKYTPAPPQESIKFEDPQDILCPYCNSRFEKMPKKSKKCPVCKKYMYRIKDYQFKVYRLITEECHQKQVEIDAQNNVEDSNKYALFTLNRYKEAGIKKVRISSAGYASCPVCRKQSGKVYSIEDALRIMPIPCKDCTFDLHGEHATVGWCRCVYIAEL